jgi:hypothetical protein
MIDDLDKLSVTELRQRGMTSDKILAEQKRRGMSKQQINDAWYPKPPTYNRIGSRRFRRRLVLATYGGWLLVAATLKLMALAIPHFPEGLFATLSFLIGMMVLLGGRTYLNREVLRGDGGLDERLVQNRNQAFRRAFQVFVIVVLLAWPLTLLLAVVEPGLQGVADGSVIFVGVVLLAVTLPTAVWKWREPDPEPEPLRS